MLTSPAGSIDFRSCFADIGLDVEIDGATNPLPKKKKKTTVTEREMAYKYPQTKNFS